MYKKVIGAFLISCLAFILLTAFSVQNNRPIFSGYANEFEAYLLSSSSKASIVKCDNDTFKTLSNVKGEGCFIDIDKVGVDYNKILADFSATVRFVEEVDGITNYYAYSPNIKYKINVLGETINLHIASSDKGIKVGSPIIFGGY